MRDDIEPLLSRLPEPAPPSSLAAGVMARIAREPDRASVADVLRSAAPDRGERRAWLWAVLGLAVVAGVLARGWSSDGFSADVMSLRTGTTWPRPLMPFDGWAGTARSRVVGVADRPVCPAAAGAGGNASS